MATGSKAGLYQNVQSASYLPLTLIKKDLRREVLGGPLKFFGVIAG